MGKTSPQDLQSKTVKQKRRLRSTKSRYLKPGALAQLRYTKISAAKSCTDLGKKRVVVRNAGEVNEKVLHPDDIIDESPTFLSPARFHFGALDSHMHLDEQKKLQRTPKTPGAVEGVPESRLESLPMDLLVNILCYLHHDQLKAVFHVSQKIRKAVILAKQLHFNYTTPHRMRQDMSRAIIPLPTDHWPFISNGDGECGWVHSPYTPKAPKHGPRPPRLLKFTAMQQIAAVLFQDSPFSSRCLVPSIIQKPPCKPLGSNRVLFYEDELCHAVSQNKLR